MKTVEIMAPPNLDIRHMEFQMYRAFQKLADDAELQFRRSYAYWEEENVPKFKTKSLMEGSDWVYYYWTEDTPYVWIDNGTDGPYTITAKNVPFLKFKVGGSPKTKPGKLDSGTGRKGKEWRTAISVEHTGIEPRNFSVKVAKILDSAAVVYFSRASKDALI